MALAGMVQAASEAALGLDFNADGQTMTPEFAKAFCDK